MKTHPIIERPVHNPRPAQPGRLLTNPLQILQHIDLALEKRNHLNDDRVSGIAPELGRDDALHARLGGRVDDDFLAVERGGCGGEDESVDVLERGSEEGGGCEIPFFDGDGGGKGGGGGGAGEGCDVEFGGREEGGGYGAAEVAGGLWGEGGCLVGERVGWVAGRIGDGDGELR